MLQNELFYSWKRRYREEGVEGLRNKPIPGRRSTLDEKDMERLKSLLEERDYWTSNQVRALIKEEFGVEFTNRHIPRILRKLGLRYQKPFVNDYRRPVDAEEILKKRLLETPLDSKAIIGLADETC